MLFESWSGGVTEIVGWRADASIVTYRPFALDVRTSPPATASARHGVEELHLSRIWEGGQELHLETTFVEAQEGVLQLEQR